MPVVPRRTGAGRKPRQSSRRLACRCGAATARAAPGLLERPANRADVWRVGAVPPRPELMVLGELAQASADGSTDIALDEVGIYLAQRFVEVVSGGAQRAPVAHARDRRRAGATAASL